MHLIFTKPSEFEAKVTLPKDLIINSLSIWKDLLQASKGAIDGTWGNVGLYLGEAARKVIGNEVSTEQIKVADSLF